MPDVIFLLVKNDIFYSSIPSLCLDFCLTFPPFTHVQGGGGEWRRGVSQGDSAYKVFCPKEKMMCYFSLLVSSSPQICVQILIFRSKVKKLMRDKKDFTTLQILNIWSIILTYKYKRTDIKISAYHIWQPFFHYPFFALTQTISFSAQKGCRFFNLSQTALFSS